MRRFFERVLNGSSIEEKQPISPSLPPDLSYSDLNYRTKRGFLARKLAHYLNVDTDGDSLLYRSISNSTFLDSERQEDLYLHLSEQMLIWFEEDKNIQQQIKSLEIKSDIQNAMLKAYEIYKQDCFTRLSIKNDNEYSTGAKPDNSKWEVYRDVIYAATQGQFLLINEEEINEYKAGTVLCEGTIKDRGDIPLCRNIAKEALEQHGYDKAKLMSWLLVLSEGITNTIKHAEEGRMTIIDDVEKNEIRFVIEDKGPGFILKDLPKTTLLAGYSTKKSMGQGFTLMMKIAKQVLLFTGPKGSIIILVFDNNKGNKDKVNLTG